MKSQMGKGGSLKFKDNTREINAQKSVLDKYIAKAVIPCLFVLL